MCYSHQGSVKRYLDYLRWGFFYVSFFHINFISAASMIIACCFVGLMLQNCLFAWFSEPLSNPFSLLRSRPCVSSLCSLPPQTAAHIRTTFLSLLSALHLYRPIRARQDVCNQCSATKLTHMENTLINSSLDVMLAASQRQASTCQPTRLSVYTEM